MAYWFNCKFNAQNIEAETDKELLIKMPHNSEYDGFKFWHPKKLVREIGCEGYFYTFTFTEFCEFKLFKSENGKYNKRDIIDEKVISSIKMKKAFTLGVEL